MTVNKASARCKICQREFSYPTERILKQVMGFHMSREHNVPGVTRSPEAKRRYGRLQYYKKLKLSPVEIEARERKYSAMEKAVAPTNGEQEVQRKPYTRKVAATTDAEPMALTSCPFCKSRFYGVKGDA